MEIAIQSFLKYTKQVEWVMSKNDTRLQFIKITDGLMYSTDGHRVHQVVSPYPDISLSIQHLDIIKAFYARHPSAKLTIKDNVVILKDCKTEWYVKFPGDGDNEYFNLRGIINCPRKYMCTIESGRKLRSYIRGVLRDAKSINNAPIQFRMFNSHLCIQVEKFFNRNTFPTLGTNLAKISTVPVFTLNAQYVLDAIKLLQHKVTIEWNSEYEAVLFKDDTTGHKALIMPMRV